MVVWFILLKKDFTGFSNNDQWNCNLLKEESPSSLFYMKDCPWPGLLFGRGSQIQKVWDSLLKQICMKNAGCGRTLGGQRTWSHVSGHHIWFVDCWFVVSEVLVSPSLFSQDAISEMCNHPIHCGAATSKAPGPGLPGSEFLLYCNELSALGQVSKCARDLGCLLVKWGTCP